MLSTPEKTLQVGYHLWEMSGFGKPPTRQECEQYEERWLIELNILKHVIEHQGRK